MRIRKRRDYIAVQRSRFRFVTDHFVVYARPNRSGVTRLGITVSRKVGRAHLRNLIKRWVREAFRLNVTKLPTGLSLVLVARAGRPVGSYADTVEQLFNASVELSRKLEKRPRKGNRT